MLAAACAGHAVKVFGEGDCRFCDLSIVRADDNFFLLRFLSGYNFLRRSFGSGCILASGCVRRSFVAFKGIRGVPVLSVGEYAEEQNRSRYCESSFQPFSRVARKDLANTVLQV